MPDVPKSGLTPSELVHRHLSNQNDVITDEDMENLQLYTSHYDENHAAEAVSGRIAAEASNGSATMATEVIKEEEESEEDKDGETEPQVAGGKPHITPWDILQ